MAPPHKLPKAAAVRSARGQRADFGFATVAGSVGDSVRLPSSSFERGKPVSLNIRVNIVRCAVETIIVAVVNIY